MEVRSPKKVAFHTLGCKVNQYDTQAMLEKFVQKGYLVVGFDEKADVYVINTCTVTNLGDRKSRQMVRRANRKNPDAVIAVVGCYAQRAAEEVMTLPGVKLVLGTKNRSKIVELVETVHNTGISINGVDDIATAHDFEEMPIGTYEGKTRAVLKIQEGCDQFCAYCIIPYARGRVRSRNPKDVLDEVKRLVKAGFKEFVLTGIHVASYGKDLEGPTLISLLSDVHSIEGVERIRLGSIEPMLLTPEFINAVRDMPKLCRHYHISLQSGCDETLKRMNRKYTTSQYKGIVDKLREQIPKVSITTDIMVGFPGEDDNEFSTTMNFVRDIRFSRIHVFQYSPREGTPAAKFPNQVPGKVKDQRSRELIALGHELENLYMDGFVNSTEDVLFEEKSKEIDGYYVGYTDQYIKVAAKGDDSLIGEIMPVFLKEVKDGYMIGELRV